MNELTIFLDVAVADAKIINDRGAQLYKKRLGFIEQLVKVELPP